MPVQASQVGEPDQRLVDFHPNGKPDVPRVAVRYFPEHQHIAGFDFHRIAGAKRVRHNEFDPAAGYIGGEAVYHHGCIAQTRHTYLLVAGDAHLAPAVHAMVIGSRRGGKLEPIFGQAENRLPRIGNRRADPSVEVAPNRSAIEAGQVANAY